MSRKAAPDSGGVLPSKQALIRRFRRIQGQVLGLQRMIEADRDRVDVLIQIASVRRALHGAAAVILRTHLVAEAAAMVESGSRDPADQPLQRTIRVFRKWVP